MKNYKVIVVTGLSLLLLALIFTSCRAGSGPESPDSEETQEPIEQEEIEIDNDQEPEDELTEETKVNTDNITINTQSSIRIEGSKTIYLDPFKRTETPHDADIVFITHDHYDHLDEPSFRNVANKDSIIVCPASMLAEVAGMNARGRNEDVDGDIISMEAGDTAEVAEGITVEAVPAYNINKNFHPKSNGWLGYIITMDGVRYYAAGDTDALPELENVECDIALVPVGGTFTETAAEAAGLVNKIHPAYAIPIHYGTIVGRAADADTFGAALDEDIKMVKKVEDAK